MIRRGLTLIETLAAAALLAAMAAACVPLLREAMRIGAPPPSSGSAPFDRLDLAELATEIAGRPSAFGIDPATERSWTVQWPLRPDLPSVEVMRLESRSDPVGAKWLVMRCGGATVLRWTPLRAKVDEHGRPIEERP